MFYKFLSILLVDFTKRCDNESRINFMGRLLQTKNEIKSKLDPKHVLHHFVIGLLLSARVVFLSRPFVHQHPRPNDLKIQPRNNWGISAIDAARMATYPRAARYSPSDFILCR